MAFLGIKLADGTFYPVITESEQGTTKLDLTTVENGQTVVQVDLYRSPDCEKTEFIDTLHLENLAPHKEGEQDISLILTLDKKGKLTAELYNPESGMRSETKIDDVFSVPENLSMPAIPAGAESAVGVPEAGTNADETNFESIDTIENIAKTEDDEPEPDLGEITLPKIDAVEPAEAEPESKAAPEEPEAEPEPVAAPEPEVISEPESPAEPEPEAAPQEILQDMSFAIDPNIDVTDPFDLAEDLSPDSLPESDEAAENYNEQTVETEAEQNEELEALEKELDSLTEVLNDNSDAFDDVMSSEPMPPRKTTPDSVIEKLDMENFDGSDGGEDNKTGKFDTQVTIDHSPLFEDGVDFERRSALKVVPTTHPGAVPLPFSEAQRAGAITKETTSSSTINTGDSPQSAKLPHENAVTESSNDMADDDEMADEEPKKPQSAFMVAFARILAFLALVFLIGAALYFTGFFSSGGNNETPEEAPYPETNLIEESDLTLIPGNEANGGVSLIPPTNSAEVDALTPVPAAEMLPQMPEKSPRKEEPTFYKIVWGDTLWDIAYTYYKDGHLFRKIAEYNGIRDPNRIVSGKVIEIPQL